jgi:hypothetical protein
VLHRGLLGRTHFSLDKQRAFLQGHGTQVLVSPVLQCPCLLQDQQFDPVCPACHGTGRYYPPDATYSTFVLLYLEDSRRTYEPAGTWTFGTIRCTTLPGLRLAERDKLTIPDIRDTYTDDTLTHGMDDTLRFDQGVVLGLVADLDRVYVAGRDYTLTPPNTVTWLAGGQAPAFGGRYAVRYDAYPQYLVVEDSPRLRIEGRVPQSQECVLQRLDRLSDDF